MKCIIKSSPNYLSAILLSLGTLLFSIVSCQREIHCPNCNNKPIAMAGPDQTITLPLNSVTLDGSASKDPDGKITSFQWRKISGPDTFNLRSPNSDKTNVDSLKKGIYQFELKVTDNSGLSDQDTVQITVNENVQPNRPPVANAGTDQTIILPTNSTVLDGSASSDPDNNITNYLWTKISGPVPSDIANPSSVQTQVSNLVEGVYQFELKVTDADGLFDKDTVQVEVKPQPSQQNLTDVNFYWTDPTKTVNFIIDNYSFAYMAWDYHGSDLRLVTIKLDTLSGFLAGIWCQNCLPDCSSFNYTYIFSIDDGATVTFNLPPGTYNWTAETTLNVFPLSPNNNPSVTQQFFDYFNTIHKANGTITVNPGGSCIIQKIVFQ